MQSKNKYLSSLILVFFIGVLLCPFLLISQTNLVLGLQQNINPGTPSDWVIPAMAGDLTVSLRGGDGGGVRFSGLICETTVEGGSGATINVTFAVGFATGELQPGGIIRAMAGQKGWSDSKACGSGAASYAGGGGSSAILYLPPGADATGMNWQMLAVAGAGGGASRPSSGIDRTGQGATAGDPSGGVNGISGAYIGADGNFGNNNNVLAEARPGAGYLGGSLIPSYAEDWDGYCTEGLASNCEGYYSMVESSDPTTNPILVKLMDNAYYNYTGDRSTTSNNYKNGGNGFTGGGAGSTNVVFGPTGGGGGGGYSGGSVNYYFGGGGGSSHVASGVNTSNLGISAGSNGASGHNDGYVRLTANLAPIVTQAMCQNQTVQLNANGQASINASQLNNGSTGFAPLTFTVNGQNTLNFTCADVGTMGVTLTLTDVYGTTSTCAATITIQDNVAPTATCQDVTVQLNAMGNGYITTCAIDGGSTDACGGFVGYSVSQTTFTCNDIGTLPVILTVSDINGNTSTCTANVTVQDNVKPVASCQNITVQLNASGMGSVSANLIQGSASDACGIASSSLDQTDFTCSDLGPNTVMLTVLDVNGNASTCSATVTVEDNINPIALCQDITIELEDDGDVQISPSDIDSGSSDACGIASLTLSTGGYYYCGYPQEVTETLTVTDVNGNSSSCTATVTISNLAPVALCQDITVQLEEDGDVLISPSDIDAGSFSICGIADYTLSTGGYYYCGYPEEVTETLTIVDNFGRSSSCTATVTISNLLPVALCKDITIRLEDDGDIILNPEDIDDGSSAICGIANLTLPSGGYFYCETLGAFTETLVVTDEFGRSSSCTATVTVEGAPIAQCKDVIVQLGIDGTATLNPADIEDGSSIPCFLESMTMTGGYYTCASIGQIAETLTINDNYNQSSSCISIITIVDNTAPTALCQNLTVELDENGMANIAENAINDGSSDPCGIAYDTNFTNFNCSHLGVNPVTLTVTDANGNSSNCQATIRVIDIEMPVLTCPSNVTIQCGSDQSPASLGMATSSDNCSMNLVPGFFDQFEDTGSNSPNTGTITRTWTVQDESGNIATPCLQTITIVDNEKPTIYCNGIDVEANLEDGDCTILVELTVPEVEDQCDEIALQWRYRQIDENGNNISTWSIWMSSSSPSAEFEEGFYKIQWQATDLSGNRKRCFTYLTVNDPDNLPCPWINNPIDCEGGSSYDYNNETFTVTSEDCHNHLANSDDEYAYVSQVICGNAEIIAQVTDISGNSNGFAGVMMRETSDVGSKMATLLTNRSSNHRKEIRTTTNGNASTQQSSAFNRHWLRLVRTDNLFRGYASSNGSSWFLKFSHTIPMDECIEVGMVLSGYTGSSNVEATFANVSITGSNPAPLQGTPPQGIAADMSESFSVYPNPSNGVFNVDLDDFLDTEVVLEVLNVNGRLVRSISEGVLEDALYEVDLSTQPSGIYLVRLQLSDGTVQVKRIVLQ